MPHATLPPAPAVRLLREVCSLPTAPFAEGRVVEYAERFVAAQPGLALSRDRWGNLLIELGKARGRRQTRREPRWVFAAHMDHPGFVAGGMRGRNRLTAAFRGSVRPEFVRGAAVRFFTAGSEVRGTVQSITVDRGRPMPVPRAAVVRVDSPVPAGSPGMFDLGEARLRGRRLHCRAIDDLGGLAAALAMLETLLRRPPKVPVAVLLTRGEEEGFIGAIAAATRPELLRRTDRIIAIECSAEQPYAPIGGGAIVRVGDRTSVFNSALTHFLSQTAADMEKRAAGFTWRRALMPGGTCEATVYDAYGFAASSMCIPLGNYHNMNRAAGRTQAEYIDLADWWSMVRLFLAVARAGHRYDGDLTPLRKRIESRFHRLRRHLRPLSKAAQ